MSDPTKQTTPAVVPEAAPTVMMDPGQAMSAEQIAAMDKAIEARMTLLDRIHDTLLKRLRPKEDLTVVAGKPRLNLQFAKLVYRTIGGRFEYMKNSVTGEPLVIRRDYTDAEGSYYVYEAFARYCPPFGNDFIEYSGSCSSRHPFFGMVDSDLRDVSEVKEDSIRTAAMTECFKKCIFTGTGMRQPTTEYLVEQGIDLSSARSVEFNAGKQSGKASGGDSKESKDLREETERMCRDMCNAGYEDRTGEPCKTSVAVLTALTYNEYRDNEGNPKTFDGWTSFEKISQRALKTVYGKIKAAFEAMPTE